MLDSFNIVLPDSVISFIYIGSHQEICGSQSFLWDCGIDIVVHLDTTPYPVQFHILEQSKLEYYSQ